MSQSPVRNMARAAQVWGVATCGFEAFQMGYLISSFPRFCSSLSQESMV
jgi:hypothetical protein